MTPDELLTELRKLKAESQHDPETAHEKADAYLLDYIGRLDVALAFAEIKKWYA